MNTSFQLRSLLFVSILAISMVSTGAHAQTPKKAWERDPEEIRHTLDSLASVSVGPYVHFAIGSCIGGRCEERVSIHRTNETAPYFYRAAGWVGMPLTPRFYGAHREIPDEEAGGILAEARFGGIMSLVTDTSVVDRRKARFWLRARFGTQTIAIDGASLGSPTYLGGTDGGIAPVFDKVERALLGPLREQYRRKVEGD